MSKKIKPLHRRTFLKGVGSTLVALPLLEIMLNSHGELLAQTNEPIPKRFVTVFCGTSISDRNEQYVYPSNLGSGYDIPTALNPIKNLNLTNDVSIVSNLRRVGGNAHGHGVYLQVTGQSGKYSGPGYYKPTGISADQLIAQKIGHKVGTSYDPGLVYCAQLNYPSTGDPFTAKASHSFDKNAQTIAAETSPAAAYRRLFGNFTPPAGSDPKELKKHQARLSVVDQVKASLEAFNKNLGRNDQRTISEHLDKIRDIERKISSLPPSSSVGACKKLTDPGNDPVSGETRYSDENKRADIMVDLAHMALVCDMHRTANLILSREQSFMNTKVINSLQGFNETLHGLTHLGSKEVPALLAKAIEWHVEKFARLAKKLKDTSEGNGTALDNTSIAFYLEAGHVNSGTGLPHTGDNMVCLVAGGKNLGLNLGQHIRANQDHPAKFFTSLMRAYGVNSNLGSYSGVIPGLVG